MKLTLWKNDSEKMFFLAMISSMLAAVVLNVAVTSVSNSLGLWVGLWGYLISIKLMLDGMVFWFFWFSNLFYSKPEATPETNK